MSVSEDPELSPLAVLRDMKAWMSFRLEHGPIRHQNTSDTLYHHPHGYAGVIIPDWEMKQKLSTVTESLEQASGMRAPQGEKK